MNPSDIYRLRPGWRLQWEEAQQRHVLLYPEGMVQLNESAGAILQRLDGKRSVEALIEALHSAYPQAPREAIAQDVHEFIDDAARQGWIHHE
ncbi:MULTISPECIES: pyrroloquinoline quinone biosynthesis peptide chaperone PqqD [Halomonadaceae]|uniref:pyrroloquinoline quinone biosynthesis peptide chaperone PqqD n=1 Tax=Halomonadaceae TaxID=28256 RepID=UPI00159B0560|nr:MULTISPECIES: pyrroloquinoline quinone biosynthesis peptide chaperone PqqD [Halomonas]QJQ94570.1 pyrroloquinoline quinone biosynthesis peptide chaperone PqqD [Halomonas sp. PA5]